MARTIAEEHRQEGIARGKLEGKLEGKIEAIIIVLEVRFGKVPGTLKKKLATIQDLEHAEEALKFVAVCPSMKEFQKALQSM